MEKNIYFELMRKIGSDYEDARDIRQKEREALISAGNWGGVKAWDEKEKRDFPMPFTDGELKAFQTYRRNLMHGTDYFEIDDLPWDYEIEDFVKTLQKAEIKDFVVTDESTGLMDGIYGLAALGCHMSGLRTVTRADDHRFGSKEPEKKNGIEFTLA